MPLSENRIMGDTGCSKLAEAITLVFGKVPFETWPGHRVSVCLDWVVSGCYNPTQENAG
jgi:hypothetical protein